MKYPIIAISTSLNISAIGIIRISFGDFYNIDINFIFKKIFKKIIKPRFATFVNLYDNNNYIIDNGIVIYFNYPFSYTGENLLEFHGHGNPYNLKFILNYFLFIFKIYKIRLALPGEFTKRAFLNKKINLLDVENIYNLINYSNHNYLKIFHKFLKLNFSLKIKKIIILINELLIFLFPFLNFDFKTYNTDLNNLKYNLNYILKKIYDIIYKLKLNKEFKKLFVIILGPPNTGKSTLFNKFLGENISIISSLPGTTRDYIVKDVSFNSFKFFFTDSAGLCFSDNKLDKISVRLSLKQFKKSDIILYLRENYTDIFYFKIFNNLKKKYFIELFNKIDLFKIFVSLEFFIILDKKFLKINLSAKYNWGINILKNEIFRVNFLLNNINLFNFNFLSLKFLLISKKYLIKSLKLIKFFDIELIYNNLINCKKFLEFLVFNRNNSFINLSINKLFNKFCIGK